jgi:hypothetical protein
MVNARSDLVFLCSVCLVLLLACFPVDGATHQDLIQDFWERSGMEPNPNEGMVLRVDFDIDGDGQTDLLLANGQTMGSSGFAEWFVYRAKSKGVFQFIGSFVSAPKSFRVLTAPPRIEVLAISRDDNDVVQSTIDTYSVSATAVTLSSSVPTDSAGASAERNKINDWQTASGFRLLAAGLDAQGRFMNAVWIEARSNQPAKNARSIEGLVVEQ